MLEIKVHDGDKDVVLRFEHSLLSLSKWEAKHKKPFLSPAPKLPSELIEYFQDMLLSPEDTTLVYALSPENLDELTNYISDPQTASSVPQDAKPGPGEQVTSELVYYWLSALQIPFYPTETWHLNRIMMLVQIANFKSQPESKRKKDDKTLMSRWASLNAERLKKYNTKG